MFVFLILCVIAQTSGHLYFHMVQSVREIVTQQVTPGHTLVVSYSTPAHPPVVPQNKSTHFLVPNSRYNANQTVREEVFSYLQPSEDLRQMILAEFNKIEAWPLLSFDAGNEMKQTAPSSGTYAGYVLLSSCQDPKAVVPDIRQQITKLRNIWEWNPRAKFVILLERIRDINAKFLAEDIFAELWTSGVVNSVVLIPTLDTHVATGTVSILDAYIWLLHRPVGKCTHVKDAFLQNRWVLDSNNNGHFLHSASFFPQKFARDLHGCPLTVSTFELPPLIMRTNTTEVDPNNIIYDKGLEIQILTELAKSINSSLKFRDTPPDGGKWGWDLGNGTWNGLTGEIASRYSDISAALLWYRCHLVTEIECLRPHLIDKVRWHVPCATPYPRWTSLTRVFKLSLWLGFITAYVIISAIMWQVVKITSHIFTEAAQNQAFASLGKCLFNFWAIILEESASNNPPNVAVVRAVFFAWVLYCWAINNVYQAYLTTFLIDPGLQHQLSSEDEILTSGIEYSTEKSVIFIYPGLQGTRYRHIIVTENVQNAENRVEKGTLALLFSMFLVQYDIALEYMDADGKPRICDIEDDFAFNLVTMFVPKGFPYKSWYDQVLLYLMQAGFVNFWWKELKYTATLQKAGDFNLPPGEYIALTMKHLQSAFYFLLLGYALSVTSFLLELSCQYRKRHTIKRIERERN